MYGYKLKLINPYTDDESEMRFDTKTECIRLGTEFKNMGYDVFYGKIKLTKL